MTPEEAARSRIEAIVRTATINAQNDGADPVEAIFDVLVAAAVMAGASKPVTTTEAALGDTLPDAVACAESWFPQSVEKRH
ncbi:MAG: hypothetical protein AAFQ90_12700 [Pseudomonadota bacterium]